MTDRADVAVSRIAMAGDAPECRIVAAADARDALRVANAVNPLERHPVLLARTSGE